MNENKKNIFLGIALAGSLILYNLERNLAIEKVHRIDLNNDGREDVIKEIGYTFYKRYEVFIQDNQDGFYRDTTFSKNEILSKITSYNKNDFK